TYIIGRNRIAQITVKNGTEQELYFTFGGHGSTRVLTDLTGAIVELYAFDAYGNAIGFDPSVALTEFLYSGEQFDSKIGQQYLRQRYYNPANGRFNRLDPFFGNIIDPLSLHNYLYCHADPISFTDPSGEIVWLPIIIGLLGGGIIGAGIGALGAWYNNGDWNGSWSNIGNSALKWGLVGALIGGTLGFAGSGGLAFLAKLNPKIQIATGLFAILVFSYFHDILGIGLLDPPTYTKLEWTAGSLIADIGSSQIILPNGTNETDQLCAAESLMKLIEILYSTEGATAQSIADANACHDFTDRVLNQWYKWEDEKIQTNPDFRDSRKKFFTVQQTDFRRYDMSNHHGTLQINLKYNDRIAHMDNGWFCSQHFWSQVLWDFRPKGNRILGPSNIPVNYYLHELNETEY
ncbi:MAG: RHS repeat-associated core domain-containing protein, partial [Bacteroidales bacterium]|nr:RHS repeat-associated core domain-containing protein [Bacteroidales bacterium]